MKKNCFIKLFVSIMFIADVYDAQMSVIFIYDSVFNNTHCES